MDAIRKLCGVGAMLLLAGAVGCGPGAADPEFFPPGQRSVHHFAEQHAAEGARSDATLHEIHFEQTQLNALGRQKLNQMLAAPARPPIIYVDIQEADARTAARVESVSRYLEQAGLSPQESSVEVGANPETGHAAAAGLRGLQQMDQRAVRAIRTE